MRLIIAGSRSFAVAPNWHKLPEAFKLIDNAVAEAPFGASATIKEVVSGGARGIDKAGEEWAKHFYIPVMHFLPDWDTYGRVAGAIRNQQMANYGDALVAIYDGTSKGTEDMIAKMKRLKKPVHVYIAVPKMVRFGFIQEV